MQSGTSFVPMANLRAHPFAAHHFCIVAALLAVSASAMVPLVRGSAQSALSRLIDFSCCTLPQPWIRGYTEYEGRLFGGQSIQFNGASLRRFTCRSTVSLLCRAVTLSPTEQFAYLQVNLTTNSVTMKLTHRKDKFFGITPGKLGVLPVSVTFTSQSLDVGFAVHTSMFLKPSTTGISCSVLEMDSCTYTLELTATVRGVPAGVLPPLTAIAGVQRSTHGRSLI